MNEKLSSLRRLAADPAASDGERAAAWKAIDRLSAREEAEIEDNWVNRMFAVIQVIKWRGPRGGWHKDDLGKLAFGRPDVVEKLLADSDTTIELRQSIRLALKMAVEAKNKKYSSLRHSELFHGGEKFCGPYETPTMKRKRKCTGVSP